MKHAGAMILLALLGACSRQEADTGNAPGAANSGGSEPNPVAHPSSEPPEDVAPTELAVKRAEDDAKEERPADGAESPAPQQPSEAPKSMQ